VIFGRARKLAGGESERPARVLSRALVPEDRPPHPLKLAEVLDWTLCHGCGDAGPAIWLITLRAW
jgi:hypothetical protein